MRTTDFTCASRRRSESSSIPRFFATGVTLVDSVPRELWSWDLEVRGPNRRISDLFVLSCRKLADIQFCRSVKQAFREDRQLGFEVLSGRYSWVSSA